VITAKNPAGIPVPRGWRQPAYLSADEHWWHYAAAAARALRAQYPPPTIRVHGPILRQDEAALLTADANYGRHSAGEGCYDPVSLLAFGRPSVMVGTLTLQGLINRHRKKAAQRDAVPRWRFHTQATVIVTTERLLCNTPEDGQMSFWYGTATEFHPDLHGRTLTLGFEDTDPLRLTGPATPALCLWTAAGVLGERWVNDPRLTPLLLT
jgi:hypothetical protein